MLLHSGFLCQLRVIKIDNRGDVIRCTTEMFKYWLQVDATASWNKLIAALRQINENHLAETICKNVVQGNSAYSQS